MKAYKRMSGLQFTLLVQMYGRTLFLALLLLVAVTTAATAPRLVRVESRKPCLGRLRCDQTFTRATFEVGAVRSEDVHLLGHGLSLHGPFHTDQRFRGDIDPDHAHLCLDEDYCVEAGQNVTIDARVSRVKTYYPLRSWLNQVPMAYYEHRNNLSMTATGPLGLARNTSACTAQYVRNTFSEEAFDFPCQEYDPDPLVTPAMVAGIDPAFADPLDVGGPPRGINRCTGVQCPPCNLGSDPTGNETRLIAMHSIGEDCRVMGIRGAPVPFVELEVTVRNHDSGEESTVYTLVPLVGGRKDVYLYNDKRLRIHARVKRSSVLNNIHGPDLEGESLVVCNGALGPRTSTRLVNPFRDAHTLGLVPVPTRRYLDTLLGPDHGVPFWYWLPREHYHRYGRRCGEVGVLEHVFRTSNALLEEVCYEGRSCVPPVEHTPWFISEEFNRYSANTTVRAALLGGGSSLDIDEAQSDYMPPRSIWHDLEPRAYLASLSASHVHQGLSLFEALVVEGHRSEAQPIDLEVRVDVSDRLLPDPLYRNVVYGQRIDPALSQCSTEMLALTYCRIGRSLTAKSNRETRPYRIDVECDQSLGGIDGGLYANTVSKGKHRASMTVELPVANEPGCYQVETPFVFMGTHAGDPPVDPQWIGQCRVTLMDGTFQHVQVGRTHTIDCIRYPTIRKEVAESDVIQKGQYECSFFSTRTGCELYGLSTIILLTLLIISTLAAIATTAMYFTLAR